MNLVSLDNHSEWMRHADLRHWLANSRLDITRRGTATLTSDQECISERIRKNANSAASKLELLLKDAQS
jgi:hypothetical protein